MKKLLFPLLAVFALTVSNAAAQTTTPDANASVMPGRGGRMQGSPEEMAKRQAERLTKELGLTADQSTKVQAILLARTQEMQAIRGQARDGSGDRSQMREQMLAGRAKYDAQFKEVLTPDQYTKFTALQADRMDRAHDMRDTRNTPDVKKMKAKTTDGDKVKVKAD
jgi:periplasmic protein CpxP/Spy